MREWEGRTILREGGMGEESKSEGCREWEGIMRTRDGEVGVEIESEGWGSGMGERDQGKGEW